MENVECPICGGLFAKSVISAHADRCLDETDVDDEEVTSDVNLSLECKRARVEQDVDVRSSSRRCSSPVLCDLTPPRVNVERASAGVVSVTGLSQTPQNKHSSKECLSANQSWKQNVQSASACASRTLKRSTKSPSLLGYFTGGQKSVQLKEDKPGKGLVNLTPATLQSDIKSVKQAGNVSDTDLHSVNTDEEVSNNSTLNRSATVQSSALSTFIPLAERMRPTMLADFVGQGHVVGSQQPLRSLLESTVVSSMILWGPPGCGKVTVTY